MSKFATLSYDHVPQRVIDRLKEKTKLVDGPLDTQCHEWQMSTGNHGYGQIGWQNGGNRGVVLTHRLSWYVNHGPIPTGMTIDHECRNRKCLNPDHLRLMSNLENAADNGQGSKTHCPRNHPYSGSNLYLTPRGHRRCRECQKIGYP